MSPCNPLGYATPTSLLCQLQDKWRNMRFSAGSLKRKAAHRAGVRDQVMTVACAARALHASLLRCILCPALFCPLAAVPLLHIATMPKPLSIALPEVVLHPPAC